MNTLNKPQITRASLLTTASYNTRWFATLLAGTTVLGTAALHAQAWNGLTDTDWNNPANWTPAGVPTGVNVTVNDVSANIATITADIPVPVDIFVGSAGLTGQVNHTAGNASTGANNWAFIGVDDPASNGTYNLADVGGSGGVHTGFGQGSGTLTVGGTSPTNGNFYIGRGGGTGVLNVNTSGGVVTKNDFFVGVGTDAGVGVGTVNLDNGTITAGVATDGCWSSFGLTGGSGTLNQSGGTFRSYGAIWIPRDANSSGTVNLSGGLFETLTFGEGLVVGEGASTTGVLNQTGGTINTNDRDFTVGRNGGGTATYTLTAGDAICTNFYVAVGAGTTGNVNLDGGTLTTGFFDGGAGIPNVIFNGTQIIATAARTDFFRDLPVPEIGAGNLLVDSNGNDVGSVEFHLTGAGGVVKTGAGVLTLSGFNDYTGDNVVNEGGLVLSGDDPSNIDSPGDITLADGTSLGVLTTFYGDQLSPGNLTLGTSGATTLNLDFADVGGFNPSDALLNVPGNLSVGGTVTVNVSGDKLEAAPLLLLTYDAASRSGAGSFVLGTLPSGVVATLVDDPNYFGTDDGAVYLDVTGVASPVWTGTDGLGTNDGVWDQVTQNWADQVTFDPTTYSDGNPVLFDDNASGPTAVTLNETVAPASITISNDFLQYSLNGTGSITGQTGLVKQGLESLTIGTLVNDYTGVTSLEGGVTTVDTLTNGGVPSALGAASSDPANLVLAGGSLNYTGAATSTDRGITLGAELSGLSHTNDLTLSGTIVTPFLGGLVKGGAGAITFTNPGANQIGKAVGQGLRIEQGMVTFDGGGTQTNAVAGELWVASVADVQADLVLNNTSLTVGGFLAISRGNGDTGLTASLTATDSTIATGSVSTGFAAGLPNNVSTLITLANTNWTNNDLALFSEGDSSTTNIVVGGTSVFTCNRFLMSLGVDTVTNVTIQDSGMINKTGASWMSIGNGNNGVATLTVKDSGSLISAAGDFNISDVDTSNGTLNIQDSAVVTITGPTFASKNAGTTALISQTGGTFNGNGAVMVGRDLDTTGQIDVTGGVFNQTGSTNLDGLVSPLVIARNGLGTLNVSGTATVNANGDSLVVAQGATGVGTVNLNVGGTIAAKAVIEPVDGGSSSLQFDGGILKATAAAANFLAVDTAAVNSGGGTIDTDGLDVTINQAFSGDGDLTILTGAGSATLTASSFHTGRLIVGAASTVTTTSATVLANASTVNVLSGSGGILNLDFAGNEVVNEFEIDGVAQGPGLYDATSNPGEISGTGVLEVVEFVETPYDSWIAGFFPGEGDPAIIGAAADPDNDGQSNSVEFALGGTPNDGSSNAKIYSLTEDGSVDGDADAELLMTIAVRTGTPAFTGNPSPSATQDGYTYTIEGSTTLATFPEGVTPVSTVATDLPTAPIGYEYRTFSLNGSNGLTTKGFLRVNVTP